MVTKEVMEILEKIYEDIDTFIKLVGLEYDPDEEEYVCQNEDQVDEDWCDQYMLDSISTAFNDISFYLDKV